MGEVKWTKEQQDAIYEKGSNILVAAAAGSGKTAVLVERIINKIINENIDIDKLLVVTFTNAAASEMRERVLNAIYKKLEDDPENEKLQRQVNLLNKANICTIDSFCLEIVRNNFYELENISPNFRIADATRNRDIKTRNY
ncbi:MAG: UvrD-helicase domain-containing protein [Clostridia bacterium]|nr:UvrD-helicase domain-containing protein [Clostridia bacterium]